VRDRDELVKNELGARAELAVSVGDEGALVAEPR
jgi:hypothetical protein